MIAAHAEARSSRGAELLGLVAFALALMLLIALATFDPHDPAPFFKAGADGSARNFIGPFGAFLAELYQVHAEVTEDLWAGHDDRVLRLVMSLGRLLACALVLAEAALESHKKKKPVKVAHG